jgi:hypothetical protein
VKLRKILCTIGLHRWGPIEDYFPSIPSEEDCARLLYGDRLWPNYPYQCCEVCAVQRKLPKTYGEMRRDLPKAHVAPNQKEQI